MALAYVKSKLRKKPGPTARARAKKRRLKHVHVRDVRPQVFIREGHICRCCQMRPAQSMHELKPRSLCGTVSLENSIAVCGSGTTGCHGELQARRIDWTAGKDGAQGTLYFKPRTQHAADLTLTPIGEWLCSGNHENHSA